MRKMILLGWIVATCLLPPFSSSQAGTSLVISITEGGGSGRIIFSNDTLTGDLCYVLGCNPEIRSRSSVRVGERIYIHNDLTEGYTRNEEYREFRRENHTLVFFRRSLATQQLHGKIPYQNQISTDTKYIDILDDGSCRLRERATSIYEPLTEFQTNYDEDLPPLNPNACSWVPQRSPEASVSASSHRLSSCEGRVSTSERQTSSNFCITIYNQCGFAIMAKLARTDHKNGGSFEVGANPTTVCSDNLDWKYELDSYLPRPGD